MCSDAIGKYLIIPSGAQLLVSVKTAESKAQQFLQSIFLHIACLRHMLTRKDGHIFMICTCNP